ncbi:glycosyltransferase [Cupriavidus sp. D384]|uniref:glycosyltransferase n=1 Tax=Cupriavidus sp. D384 TaxID=1538095 RepID=UPI000AC18D60|nr:glycosyltransferase [Cupriavidus sp. D384]
MRSFFRWLKERRGVHSSGHPATGAGSALAELVDADYYRQRHGAALGSLAPVEHYARVGASADADPNPVFDSAFYLTQVGVQGAGAAPTLLEHYLAHGERSGLQPSPIFDPRVYLTLNPDVAAAGVNALEHFVRWGWKEGRQFVDVTDPGLDAAISRVLDRDRVNPVALALNAIRNAAKGDLASARRATGMLSPTLARSILPPMLNSLAERLWVKGELTKAVLAWEQSRYTAPDTFSDNGNLGLVLRALGRLDEALVAFREAVARDDDRPTVIEAVRAIEMELALGIANAAPALGSDAAIQLFDTSFPSRLSSFRFGEFSAYLRELPDSRIQSSIWDIKHLHQTETFADMARQFAAESGTDPRRIELYRGQPVTAAVGYCVFLNNANLFFSERANAGVDTFAFTLYPGGGFELADANSDHKLRRLCDNSRLGKIITTQNLTYRYLLDNQFCEPDRLLHLFGGVVPMCFDLTGTEAMLAARDTAREALHVCFVAQRYSATGVEKGYDVFVALAEHLRDRDDIYFHVVGGFDAETIPLKPGARIQFHGIQPSDFFPVFYGQMDVIVSPNISGFRLNDGRGSFDGFPTTCCVEASLCGAAMFLSDFEGLNATLEGKPIFENGSDFEQIDRDAEAIAGRLLHYADEREALRAMARRGRNVILREMSREAQILPRIAALQDLGQRSRHNPQ